MRENADSFLEDEEVTPPPTSYFEISSGPFLSVTFLIPLIILYEAGTFFIDTASRTPGMRNAADVWTKQLFSLFGLANDAIVLAVVITAVWLVSYLNEYTKHRQWPKIRVDFLGYMFAESLVYGLMLGTVVNWLMRSLIPGPFLVGGTSGLMTNLILSLGAGIYEELVFRFFLLSALMFLLGHVFGKEVGAIIAIALGSLIFSGFHYIGPYGDPIELGSVLFRFFGGVVLSVLYLARGIGIVAYAHAIYDVQYYLFYH